MNRNELKQILIEALIDFKENIILHDNYILMANMCDNTLELTTVTRPDWIDAQEE